MNAVFPTGQPFPAPLAPTAAPVAPPIENVDATIMEWYAAAEQLASIKAKEMELRKRLVNSQLFDPGKVKGTQSYQLGQGYVLKADKRESVSVANSNNEVADAVARLKALGGLAIERADEIFKMSARMSESTYKAMTPEERAIVDPLITRKPGTPLLTLKEPKPE